MTTPFPAPPREPTSDECSNRTRIGTNEWAFWWPQMGGYTAPAVVVADPANCCVDVWVWHDGQFPFAGDCHACGLGRSPSRIHMTDGDNWIRMGEFFNSLPTTLIEENTP